MQLDELLSHAPLPKFASIAYFLLAARPAPIKPQQNYARVPALMDGLTNAPRKSLVTITGGASRGDPCEAFAHHGYNGNEDDVVRQIVGWIVAR